MAARGAERGMLKRRLVLVEASLSGAGEGEHTHTRMQTRKDGPALVRLGIISLFFLYSSPPFHLLAASEPSDQPIRQCNVTRSALRAPGLVMLGSLRHGVRVSERKRLRARLYIRANAGGRACVCGGTFPRVRPWRCMLLG
ncbi:hypothetical protein DPEC_G00111680 [Dallia pectoralis]|uniref:Uncharacterized protein n=1 Tax=Dallia pectoralis TaxID=75939 RepID=A0ACC2GT01_DALPE|nr:hypothetical protein DPEC_G00111680 [Dallia pectoralis]